MTVDPASPANIFASGHSPPPSEEVEQGPVELDRISSAPIEIPPAGNDKNALKEQATLAYQQETFKRELGSLGIPFGGRREKPGNISALVITLIFCFLWFAFLAETIISIWHPEAKPISLSFDKLFSGMMSIVTLILGYLFGSNDRADK